MFINYLEIQKELELKYIKNKNILTEYLITKKSILDKLLKNNIYYNFGLEVLSFLLEKQTSDSNTLISKVVKYFNNDGKITFENLYKLAEINLIDYHEDLDLFISKYTIPKDIKKQMDKYQYPFPLLIKPIKPKDNMSSSYLTFKQSCILNDNHHLKDICLDHLHLCNSIELSINVEIFNTVKNNWKNINTKKKGESVYKYKLKQKAFKEYNRKAKDTINIMVNNGNKFRLDHAYDKRGRIYARGYQISTQGNDWNKSLIEFYNKEVVKHE